MGGIWNFPAKLKNKNGVVYYPTRVKMPEWATVAKQEEGERRISFGELKLSKITSKFDLGEIGLSSSPLFPELPPALDSLSILPAIKTTKPVDRTEIVEWMQHSCADNAILTARMEEYNKYSRVDGAVGDSYIPGVRVSDVSFISRRMSETRSLGYGEMNTPRGNVRIPPGSGKTLIARDFLAWGAVGPVPDPLIAEYQDIQWEGKLLKWRELAQTPISSAIGFPSYRGIVAPNFFVQTPEEESSRVRVSQTIASDKDQRIPISFRSPSDYTNVIDEDTIRLDKGTTEISYVIASYPSVPPVVFHAQPENGCATALNEYYVEAI